MSILSGFKRFKRYTKTNEGYIPSYEKTIANAVCFGDGTDDNNTVETNLSAIKGITTSTSVTETGYAADATVINELNSNIANVDNKLNNLQNFSTLQKIGEFGVYDVYREIFSGSTITNGNYLQLSKPSKSFYSVKGCIFAGETVAIPVGYNDGTRYFQLYFSPKLNRAYAVTNEPFNYFTIVIEYYVLR